ncbi:hypothetical protein E2C01_058570 [Portunus trituberculatus]|uniref:Uncharacterized protein n=1 Tax=Portunus trituberculatus TaxID=210409 RepID=A0A5B7H6H7_PORTR|nr:hypothetical protein [Portunus trituberculatus]
MLVAMVENCIALLPGFPRVVVRGSGRCSSSDVKLFQFLAEGKARREVIMVYDSGEGSQGFLSARKNTSREITKQFTMGEVRRFNKHTNTQTT